MFFFLVCAFGYYPFSCLISLLMLLFFRLPFLFYFVLVYLVCCFHLLPPLTLFLCFSSVRLFPSSLFSSSLSRLFFAFLFVLSPLFVSILLLSLFVFSPIYYFLLTYPFSSFLRLLLLFLLFCFCFSLPISSFIPLFPHSPPLLLPPPPSSLQFLVFPHFIPLLLLPPPHLLF